MVSVRSLIKAKRWTGVAINILVILLVVFIVQGIAGVKELPSETTQEASTGAPAPTTVSGQTTLLTQSNTSSATTPATQSAEPTTAAGTTAAGTTTASNTPPVSTTAFVPTNGYMYNYPGINPKPAVINNGKWYLILVNRSYFVTPDYPVVLVPAVIGVNEAYRLDERAATHYRAMYAAALKTGNKLTPLSGHRRFSTQKTNYENKISFHQNQGMSYADAVLKAAESIMPPGCSEHHTGLAMDIGNISSSFQYSNEYKWLKENAADYGFILRYPADKTSVTKVKYEPWHWRYVGVEAAKAMNASGQCLEEYLGMTG